MKQKLKLLFALSLAGILLLGCQEEAIVFKSKQNVTIEKFAFINQAGITNPELKKSISKLSTLLDKRQSKSASDSVFNFTYNNKQGVHVKDNEYDSYTFQVNRNNGNGKVENIVFSENKLGTFDTYLINYDFTENEYATLSQNVLGSRNKTKTEIDLTNGTISDARGGGGCWGYVIIQWSHDFKVMVYVFEVDCPPDGGGGSGSTGGSHAWTSSGSYGNGGLGTGNGNTGDPRNGGHGGGPNEPIDTFDFGTVPVVVPTIPTKPCIELNKMTANTNIRNTYNGPNGLESKVYEPIEYGNAFSRGSNYDTTTPIPNNINNPSQLNLDNFVGGDFYGANHSHNDPDLGSIPMFPLPDIRYLYNVSRKYTGNNGQPKDYTIFVLTVTVPSGTFALKIKDVAAFYAAMTATEKYDKMLKDLKYEYTRIGTSDMEALTKALLNSLKENNVGVGLYKAEANYSNWSELTLDPLDKPNDPKPIIETPCN